ncbi:MAG: hypothetical protein EOO89_23580, partial [Pedobacter sp.]
WVRIYSGPINVRWFGAVHDDSTTDVSTEVQAAVNFAAAGTIYFPAGKYVCSVEISNTNILGDGYASRIISYNGSACFKLQVATYGWVFKKMSNLNIYGTYLTSVVGNGVELGEGGSNPEYAGTWVFENVTFEKCSKGIFKSKGNIGNTFLNCTWFLNDFGYYAQGYNLATMHAGADKFIGGEMHSNSLAAIFLKDHTDGFGQLILDGTIIEGNPGFGVYIQLSGAASIVYTSISFNNVWMESNATSGSVIIDSLSYSPFEFRFDNVRSVSLRDSKVSSLKSVGSSISLYSCRIDNGGGTVNFEVDSNSNLVAYETRNNYLGNDNVFTQSISFDATLNNTIPSKYWSPLRSNIILGASQVQLSDNYDVAYNFTGSPATVAGTLVSSGVLKGTCNELVLPSGYMVSNQAGFVAGTTKFYFYSIHAFLVSGDAVILFRNDNGHYLGQAILKAGQWSCTIGIKKFTAASGLSDPMRVWISSANGSTVQIADVQAVAFDNYVDAISFANSRSFAG